MYRQSQYYINEGRYQNLAKGLSSLDFVNLLIDDGFVKPLSPNTILTDMEIMLFGCADIISN